MKKALLSLYALWVADTKWDRYTKKQKRMAVWFGLSVVAFVMAVMAIPPYRYILGVPAGLVCLWLALEKMKNIDIDE